MGTIVARGPKWRAVVRKHGQTRTRTFSKVALARRWIAETELGLETHAARGKVASLSALLEKYRTEIVEKRPYQTKTHFHLIRLARDARGVMLHEMDADWWVRFTQGLACGAGSRGRYLTLVTGALKAAEALWGYTVDWSAYRRGRAMMRQLQLVGSSRPRERRPTQEELTAIRAAARSVLPLADLIDFAIASCMRAGEICRIRWSDLDRERRMVVVRDRKHPTKKIGNDWSVPLFEGAFEVVERQPRTADEIFPFKTDSVLTAFRRACTAAGVKDLHFHDLRHEGISRLFERGFSIQEVALVSGHTNWSSLRIYTQIRPIDLHSGPVALRIREKSTIG